MKRRFRFGLRWVLVAVAGAAAPARADPPPPAPAAAEAPPPAGRFVEVAAAAGIAARHARPVLDHRLDNIMAWVTSVGAAAAAADGDGDGRIDLYVTQSRKGRPNALYHNNGDGSFTDVAAAAGVAEVNGAGGTSMDCVFGDYDNDGDADLYLVRWGRDILFQNDGDGTFTDVTARCFRGRDGAPGAPWANGNAAIFFDYDHDGRLDLYVGNYFDGVDLWHLSSTRIMHEDFEHARNGGRNFLYRQAPDGTFTDVAEALGVDDPGWTLAVGSADLDGDGWPDLYCADDFGPDQLFLNRRDGTFENVSAAAIGRDTKKGMNVDFGDYDNDGRLDVYVTNITTAEYLQEGNMLWHNDGAGPAGALTFTDVALETGTFDGGWGWGAKFLDADNDGDLDLFAVNGFISAGAGNYWYDLASWSVRGEDPAEAGNWPAIGDRSFSGHERFRYWRNEGWSVFTERAGAVGLDSDRDGRGVVCFDYDDDGDVDLFVANQDQRPQLFRNDLGPGRHWLEVALVGGATESVSRDAIGTQVMVVAGGRRQLRERDGGNGYAGQSDPRLHFGLGTAERIDRVEVRWPDGGEQRFDEVPVDRLLTVHQDPRGYSRPLAAAPGAPVPAPPATAEPAPPAAGRAAGEGGDRDLAALERQLARGPLTAALAGRYRARCAANGRHDRSIAFFQRLHRAEPRNDAIALQLACAYVDKIPTCGGVAAIVSKGRLAQKSLNVLDRLLEKRPDWWLAYYCRGMNHLHWPRALRHSDEAAADFRRCLELQGDSGGPGAPRWHLRAYVALGDALAKQGRYEGARRAWREGLGLFPGDGELTARLAIEDERRLLAFVLDRRSLQRPIDTDLSFIER